MAGKGVHHRRAHAVEPAGHLVPLAAELAARVQHRQAHLHRRAAHLGMNAHGEAAPVVLYGHGRVLFDGHVDFRAEARQRFVDGVVHDFIYAVMQPPGVGGTDVHAGALAHRLQPLQHLNLGFVIMRGALQLLGIQLHFVSHFILP